MKRKLLLVALLSVAVVGGVWATSAVAFDGRKSDSVTLGQDEVVDGNFYAYGKNVTIAGVVKGDVYCAGRNIEVTGTVEGDIVCAAQEMRVSGTVQGSVRAVGLAISIAGQVERNVSVAAQIFAIEHTGRVARDVSLATWTSHIDGAIGRDLVSASSYLNIAGSIARDVQAVGEGTTLQPTAQITGSLTQVGHKNAELQTGASVGGEVSRQDPPKLNMTSFKKPRIMHYLGSPVYWFFVFLACGALVRLLVPRWAKSVSTIMLERGIRTFGVGLAGAFALPLLSIILLFTLIGLPLGLMTTSAWLTIGFFSIIFAIYSGATLTAQRVEVAWLDSKQLWWAAFVLILVGLLLLTRLPVAGGLIGILASIWGFGGIVSGLVRTVRLQHLQPKTTKKG